MRPQRQIAARSTGKRRRTAGESGQAALALVLGLMIILVTGASLLAANAINHDPLVQNDAIQHYAYRGLESGVNTYLSSVNTNSNLINCSSSSASGGQCTPTDYGTWKAVQGTGVGNISEWYLWGNPVFCFNNQCSITGGTASTGLPLLYVKVQMWGAAGVGNRIVYQSSTENLTPVNGFLTRIWWSNYESTDPAGQGYSNGPDTSPAYCTYDWNNAYNGTNLTGNNVCSEVYFDAGAQIYGPIYSNDSIYVSGTPTLGPVKTHDPNCLFVTGTGGQASSCSKTNAPVSQSATDAAGNAYNQPLQPIPTSDSALATLAQLSGCFYQGPTTLHFNATAGNAGTMNVWSPDSTSTSTAAACLPSSAGGIVNVPNGSNGNGVIFVGNSPTTGACGSGNGANPFDNWTGTTYGSNAQLNYKGSYSNFWGAQAKVDCEGDAFVGDSPTGGGISGQITVASANNVVITNDLEYVNCGSAFNYLAPHPVANQCTYNSNSLNDALGLIATQYVEVNHPVKPCANGTSTCTSATSAANTTGSTLEPACTAASLANTTAALCDPDGTGGNGVVIDGAILSLSHSFAVNNEGLINSSGNTIGIGGTEPGNLVVYGAIDQDWRGIVDVNSGASGYIKYYQWDSLIQAVSPPYYLNPGTPSWQLVSSASSVSSNTTGAGVP